MQLSTYNYRVHLHIQTWKAYFFMPVGVSIQNEKYSRLRLEIWNCKIWNSYFKGKNDNRKGSYISILIDSSNTTIHFPPPMKCTDPLSCKTLCWHIKPLYKGGFHDIKHDMDHRIESLKHHCKSPIVENMMTSSNGNIFRVTAFVREYIGHRLISPHKGQWRGGQMFSLICAWISGWVNNEEGGHLTRHGAHYDVTVMNVHLTQCWVRVISAIIIQQKIPTRHTPHGRKYTEGQLPKSFQIKNTHL